jgi:hypothetical protein
MWAGGAVMSISVWWLSIIGLLVAIIGSGLLYLGTPHDTGGIHLFSFGDDQAPQKEKMIKLRRNFSRLGFIMLLIGFILQLITVLMQMPK